MDNMLDALKKGLEKISQEEQNIFIRQERSVQLCITTLTELKATVLKQGFPTKQGEIRFFKTVKPRFESLLKYHAALFDLEKHKPHSGIRAQQQYFEEKLQQISALIQSDLDFYVYYKTNSKHLDEVYYTRCSCPLQLALQNSAFDIDLNFRSSHDHKIAQILAYEMLCGHLKSRIKSLENKTAEQLPAVFPAGKFTWQAPKAALIELIYALNSQLVFGNAHTDIKELVAFFEQVFNVQLGDCYGIFRDIKDRKSNRTKFLDSMKEGLIRQLDLVEEFSLPQKRLF